LTITLYAFLKQEFNSWNGAGSVNAPLEWIFLYRGRYVYWPRWITRREISV